MRTATKQYFIASVKDDYMDQIDLVADQLRLKGCEIRQILKLSGVITGRVDKATHLDALRIEGISSIEKQRMVRKK